MKTYVTEKNEHFDCDNILINMIKQNYIKPGDKFHFFGLYLMKKSIPEPDSERFIEGTQNFYL
jgi:hypothetical protein